MWYVLAGVDGKNNCFYLVLWVLGVMEHGNAIEKTMSQSNVPFRMRL